MSFIKYLYHKLMIVYYNLRLNWEVYRFNRYCRSSCKQYSWTTQQCIDGMLQYAVSDVNKDDSLRELALRIIASRAEKKDD
jgi:hypothetical protein